MTGEFAGNAEVEKLVDDESVRPSWSHEGRA